MATGAEEVALGVILVEAADKLSNLVQGIDTVVGWMKAQEGFKYNLYAFSLEGSDDPAADKGEESKSKGAAPATLAKPNDAKKKASIAGGTGQPIGESDRFFFLSLLANGPVEGSSVLDSRADFKIARASRRTTGSRASGYVYLTNLEGFDTAIGSQAEVEFAGQDLDAGHLLTFRGFVNKVGRGFGHFSGSVLFDHAQSKVRVLDARVVPEDAGRIVNSGDHVTLVF